MAKSSDSLWLWLVFFSTRAGFLLILTDLGTYHPIFRYNDNEKSVFAFDQLEKLF